MCKLVGVPQCEGVRAFRQRRWNKLEPSAGSTLELSANGTIIYTFRCETHPNGERVVKAPYAVRQGVSCSYCRTYWLETETMSVHSRSRSEDSVS